MTTASLPTALDLRTHAQKAEAVSGQFPLAHLPRITADIPVLAGDLDPVHWSARLEWRQAVPDTALERSKTALPEAQLWLHLQVEADVPQVCQRCLSPYPQPLNVDRWFRFVASEAVALAEDDDCEEDLLVFEPRFDLLTLIEDELLLDLPLVPMHSTCPEAVPMTTGELPDSEAEKPHPFAALATLKRSNSTH